jgi:apolipoprotein N-acyltransferase
VPQLAPFGRPILLTALSALLFVLAFPPYGVWPFAFVCVVPWMLALPSLPSRRAAFISGIGLSVGITVGGYFWVGTTLQHFGGLPAPVAALGCVLFGLFNQIQFAVWGAIAWRSNLPTWKLVVLYCAFDWSIPKLFMDTLGLTFVNVLPLAQWAEHVGMYGLTILIFSGNLILTRGFVAWRAKEKHPWRTPLRWAGVAAVLGAIGFWRQTSIDSHIGSGPFLNAGVIQANIGDFEKVASEQGFGEAPNVVVKKYVSMLELSALLEFTFS